MVKEKSVQNPLISIVMPVYNAERYLREAIDSILRQTYDSFELIIINDGSTDASWDIIQHYARFDERIVAINQDNKGVVDTANYGASIAKGQYISRHDADDVSYDTKYADLIDAARKNPQAIIITGNIEVIDEAGDFLYRELVPVFSEDIKRALYYRNPIPNGATMMTMEAFQAAGGYDNVFAEDCHLWVKLLNKGDFIGTGTTVYRWRMNSAGLTLSNNDKSVNKEKEYTGSLWKLSTPRYIPRTEIIHHSKTYITLSDRYGVDFKKVYLYDLARLSVHLIKHRHIAQGIRQLAAIASTGRTGMKVVLHRFGAVLKGQRERINRTGRTQNTTELDNNIPRGE